MFNIADQKNETDGKWFQYPYELDVEFCICHISKSDLKATSRKYQTQVFDKETHQKIMVDDKEKMKDAIDTLILEKVVGWKGIKDGKEESLFSKLNLKKLMDRYGDRRVDVEIDNMTGEKILITLSSWIIRIATDPGNFMDEGDLENLSNSSKGNGTGI